MKKSILIFCLVSLLTAQAAFAQQAPGEETPTPPNTEQAETTEPPTIPLTPLLPPSSDPTEDGGPASSGDPAEDGNEPQPNNGIPENNGAPGPVRPQTEEKAPLKTGEPPSVTDPPETGEQDIFHPAPGEETMSLPVPPTTKPGAVFLGWNTDPDASEGFQVCCLPKENLVLYPIWETEQPDAPEEDNTDPPAEETPGTGQPQQQEENLPDAEQTPPATEPPAGEAPDAGQPQQQEENLPDAEQTPPATEPPAEEAPGAGQPQQQEENLPDMGQLLPSVPESLEEEGTDVPPSQESPEASELPSDAEGEASRSEQELPLISLEEQENVL